MKRFVAVVTIVLAAAGAVQADTLAVWNNDNIYTAVRSNAVHSTEADISAGSLELGTGLVAPGDTWENALDSYVYTNVTSLSDAISSTHYYSFTVAPNAGKQVDYSDVFTRVTLNDSQSAGASLRIVLMSSATGFTDGDEIGSFVATTQPGMVSTITNSYDVSGVAALQNNPSEVEFRLYVIPNGGSYSRVALGHIFFVDNADDVRVEGIVEDSQSLPVLPLAMWDNDSLSGSETNSAVNTVAAGISAGDLAQSYRWYNSLAPWPNSLWALCSDLPGVTNLATAIAEDRYYSFTVTPDSQKILDFKNIAARITLNSAGNAGTSVTLFLMSSVTGFTDGDEIGSFVAVHDPNDGAATDNGLKEMDISGVAALQNITSEVEFRLYIVLNDTTSNRLGFGHIFFVDEQADLLVQGTIDDIPVPDIQPPEIIGWSRVSNNVMKLVVNAPSAANLYFPENKTDLVLGSWTNVAHSDDGVNAFVITNLSYSTAEGTNEVIYVHSNDAREFFRIKGVQ